MHNKNSEKKRTKNENDSTATEFTVAAEDIDLVEELLISQGFSPVIIHPPESEAPRLVRIHDFSEKRKNDRLKQDLQRLFAEWNQLLSTPVDDFSFKRIEHEEWAETWKQHFKPLRIGQRLIIKPSWETIDKKPGESVVELNPGMCFGTGSHGTTRACLEMLEKINRELGPNHSLLDAGCGSGIISLAAAALDFYPVVAFDNDPESVRITRENIANSGISSPIEVDHAELAEYTSTAKYRVVIANILASILLRHADILVNLLDHRHPPAYLVVSGILIQQYPEVKTAFLSQGLIELENIVIDEWQTGCFATSKRADARRGAAPAVSLEEASVFPVDSLIP